MHIIIFTNEGQHLDFYGVKDLNYTGRVLTFSYTGKRTGLTSKGNFVNISGWVEMGQN